MTKQEQKLILDTIENIYNEKINKLQESIDLEKNNKLITKEKITTLETENKALKQKNKELEKELNACKKEIAKYDKLLSGLKK